MGKQIKKLSHANKILNFMKRKKVPLSAYEILDGLATQGITAPTTVYRALNKLVNHGWKIGLRFDPLIFYENWKKDYKELFSSILGTIDVKSIHSVSCGPLRFPKKMYNKIFRMYPEEKILSASLELRNKSISNQFISCP